MHACQDGVAVSTALMMLQQQCAQNIPEPSANLSNLSDMRDPVLIERKVWVASQTREADLFPKTRE